MNMFRLLLICLFGASLSHAAATIQPAPASVSDAYRSVLRIECATQTPDYQTPWNSGKFGGGIGTGFLIGKNKILTNAHVVSNARRLLITIHGSAQKHPAKVEFIAHDCDLAVLSVEDFTPFESIPVFEFGDVPKLESQVRVIGYPVGGDRISVTRGVVSRIDFQPYSHTRSDSHLAIQIDAAINPGNSGGPVIQDGKVIGVAFQGLQQADNTGYIIPNPVISRFLKDIEDGKYDHYADLGIQPFPLYNPAMRKALGMSDDQSGVLITRVTPSSTCDGVLKAGDIITALDGTPVDRAGMVTIKGEQMNLSEIVERKFAGDDITIEYLRAGKFEKSTIKLKSLAPKNLYSIQYEKTPRYTVFGGLVFQPLDTNLFITSKFQDIEVRRLFNDYLSKGLFQKRQDIVILTQILSNELTNQLYNYEGLAVNKINGIEVNSLKQLHELLNPEVVPEFFVIELFNGTRPIVLPSSKIAATNETVQQQYSIPQLTNLQD